MPIIKREDADALCDGIYELLVLTHLQGQLLFGDGVSVFDDDGLTISHENGLEYVWERQRDALQDLKRLIEKEEFLVKESAPPHTARAHPF